MNEEAALWLVKVPKKKRIIHTRDPWLSVCSAHELLAPDACGRQRSLLEQWRGLVSSQPSRTTSEALCSLVARDNLLTGERLGSGRIMIVQANAL
jgi:hypothetical protein